MLIQILISLFALFALWRIFLKKRKSELKTSEYLIWLILWLAIGIIVWIPNATQKLADLLGIGRGVDLVLYISIIILFYLIFRIYIHLEKIERNITKVVRKDALDEK